MLRILRKRLRTLRGAGPDGLWLVVLDRATASRRTSRQRVVRSLHEQRMREASAAWLTLGSPGAVRRARAHRPDGSARS